MTLYTRKIPLAQYEGTKNTLESIGHPVLGRTAIPGEPLLCLISFGDVTAESHADCCDHGLGVATHDKDLPVAVGGVA